MDLAALGLYALLLRCLAISILIMANAIAFVPKKVQ
jgi:hypothetical protein